MSTTYAQQARKTLGPRSASVYRLIDVLAKYADATGLIDRELETLYREANSDRVDMGVIGHAGLVQPVDLDGSKRARIVLPVGNQPEPFASPGPSGPPAKATPRKPPVTGVETRDPVDQNDHTLAMINSHQLSKQAQHVAMVASVELAISAARSHLPFARAERELAHSYLAGKTGWSDRAVRTAMAEATNLGFFERVDHAQGGRNGKGRSTYRPRLPVYFETPER